MILCIDGTEITELVLASVDGNGDVVRDARIATRPEEFLSHITAFVQDEPVEGVIVVRGPGSATALRASIAIAETLAFATHVPVAGIARDAAWKSALVDGVVHPSSTQAVYAHEARITPSKKDSLRRQTEG